MEALRGLFEQAINGFDFLDAVGALIVNLLLVIVWIVIGVILVKISKKLTFRVLKVSNHTSRSYTVSKLISNIIKYTIWFIIFVLILTELGINIMPFIASAGVVGLAIGFGSQEIVKDFISGFFIILDDVFNIGDIVECTGFKGEVLELGLRTTRIKNYKGEIKIINNGDMKNVINYSKNNSLAIIDFGVSYDTDLRKVSELMKDFVVQMNEKYEEIVEEPKFLGVTELASSSINMRIFAKTQNSQHFHIEREIRKEVVIFLNSHDIEIPFPQVVVHNA